MDILEHETNPSKSRWVMWFGLSLLIILGIGIAVVKFDSIKTLFKPKSPVELADLAIINGNEQQRFDALTLTKKDRLQVNLETVKNAFSSDNSLRVRQLALEIIIYRLEKPAAKTYLEQVMPMESNPKIKQIINYSLQRLSEEISWLYKE